MTLSDPNCPPADSPAPDLEALRVEIDRIDEALHGLLMSRGEIIDRLIAVKARQGGGSAFRPGREAAMMRRLVTRHAGILPLATVESIWRIIISTFTYVQTPYSVHADIADGDAAMRDSCRFHFGFTVPLLTHTGAAAVIAAVAAAEGDLGLVRVEALSGPAWWDALLDPAAPKIIARLPFVERADHAAGLPLFVVAKPLAGAAVNEIGLFALEGASPQANAHPGRGIEVIAAIDGRLIVAAPECVDADGVAAAFAVPVHHATWIGSHARRFEIDAGQSLAAQ